MKPSLQLKFSQQLTMTPQLQQAIKLLQLSTLDLQAEIQEALDSNPLLEVDEQIDSGSGEKALETNHSADSKDSVNEQVEVNADSVESGDALQNNDIPKDLPLDSTWDEYLSASSAPASMSSAGSAGDDDQVFQGETTDNIQDHLLWQMRLTHFSDTDIGIAMAIIDSINEAGYLTISTEEVMASMDDEEIELDEVEVVLKRIQMFDPIGSGARCAQECLLIQLRQFAPDTPWLEEAKMLITDYCDLIGSKDYRTLMRKTRLKEEELREAMRLLKTLNPRPGTAIVTGDSEYVIPDVSVAKKNGRWTVELNPDSLPKLNVNQQYAAMSKSVKSIYSFTFTRSQVVY